MSDPQGRAVTETVIGEVRAHLARQRLTGKQAAARMGWSQAYISRRLTGDTPFDVADLAQLGELLDVAPAVFFAGPEVRKVQSRSRLGLAA